MFPTVDLRVSLSYGIFVPRYPLVNRCLPIQNHFHEFENGTIYADLALFMQNLLTLL